MGLHLRNIETGDIKVVEADSDELAALRRERTESGRFPLWEQTSAGDADPEKSAAAEEVQLRERHGLPLHDVTADGVGQSDRARAKLDGDDDSKPKARSSAKAPAGS